MQFWSKIIHDLLYISISILEILILNRRVPPVDVIVMKADSPYTSWEELVEDDNKQAVIGTSAVRRIAQLQGKYPNLKFTDIRGNLNTRLKKLDDPEGPYQAIILAKAGMMRLDWHSRIHRVSNYLIIFHHHATSKRHFL